MSVWAGFFSLWHWWCNSFCISYEVLVLRRAFRERTLSDRGRRRNCVWCVAYIEAIPRQTSYINHLNSFELAPLQTLVLPYLVKKFAAYYGTRRFIIMGSRNPHDLILSQINPTCRTSWRSVLIFSHLLRHSAVTVDKVTRSAVINRRIPSR